MRLLSGFEPDLYKEKERAKTEKVRNGEYNVTLSTMTVGAATPFERYQINEMICRADNRWKEDFKTDLVQEMPKNDLPGDKTDEISGYHFVKSFDKVHYPNPLLIQDNYYEYVMKITDDVNNWLKENEKEFAKARVYSPVYTGYTILNSSQEKQLEYEFSSASVRNKIYAVWNRQLASNSNIDKIHLHNFDKMTDKYFEWFFSNFDEHVDSFDALKWLYSKSDFSLSKKRKYDETITKQKYNPSASYSSPFIARVKGGEVCYTQKIDLDSNGHIITEDRPRLI